jgi:hypothetical protein
MTAKKKLKMKIKGKETNETEEKEGHLLCCSYKQ